MNEIKKYVILKCKKVAYPVLVIFCCMLMMATFLPFPTIILYYDGTKTRPMLALITRRGPEAWGFLAVIRGDFDRGLTLGRYRIETEHGEIVIGNFSEIQTGGNRQLVIIHRSGVEAGRVTHNLVVNGVPLHYNLRFSFLHDGGGRGVSWPDHEAIVSGVPLLVRSGGWGYGPWGSHPFFFQGITPPEDIILADTVRISLSPITWRLVFNGDETWCLQRIGGERGSLPFFLVMHPGETEYRKYTSITFGQYWGDFISGELFVEE